MDDRPTFTLLDALVHRHRFILGIAAAFCLAAAALSLVMPKTYEATAIIYLDTARTASDFDAGIAAGDLVQHDFIVSATSRPTLQQPGAAPHEAELHRLQNAYGLTLARLLDLNGRQDRLTNVATIVQPALPPTKPESPNPLLYVGAALVAGLGVGVFAALLIERLDDRIVSAEGLARAASIPPAFVTQNLQRLLFPRAKSSSSRAPSNFPARSPHPLRETA